MGKRNFKFYVREYFTFSKSERNGILTLVILISLVLLAKALIPRIISTGVNIDVTGFEKEIAGFEKSFDSVNSSQKSIPMTTGLNNLSSTSVRYKNVLNYKIEINSADTNELVKLPGIGHVFAQRIIKYRELLRGFYTLNQLNEVYGLNTETIEKLKKHLSLDTTKIRKLDINTFTFKEINSHPYISYEQTKAIFKFRSKRKFNSTTQLTENKIFSDEELKKVLPYIVIN
jgi:competence ComEA-like helix-hairpin-helix protein